MPLSKYPNADGDFLDLYTQGLRCDDCELRFKNWTEKRAHDATHIERPHDDALTIAEVAKALGKTKGAVLSWVKKGKLRHFRVPQGRIRIWVMRKQLKEFVKQQLEDNPARAKDWVEGKGL